MNLVLLGWLQTIENPVIAVGCLLAVGGAGPNPAVERREAVLPLYAEVGLIVPLLGRYSNFYSINYYSFSGYYVMI